MTTETIKVKCVREECDETLLVGKGCEIPMCHCEKMVEIK